MAFNGRFVLNIAHFAARQGASLESLIALSGQDAASLSKEDCSVSDLVYNNIIEEALNQTNDPYLGLHAGESQNLSAIGLILQIAQSSESVKEALEYCCQFANLGCSALPMILIEEKDYYKVKLSPNPVWKAQSALAVRHTTDGVLAFTLREFHSLTREKHRPIAIHLTWDRPTTLQEYERVFDCPVYYRKDEIALLLQKKHVEDKVITADHHLLKILLSYAETKSNRLLKEKGFQAIVRQSVIALIKPTFPTIEQVASHLNLSLRTLQRRLKEEGFTYKQLIDDLRKDFALSYIKRKDLSITEIAYLLDYADNSAFSRSFKRWTGTTPRLYRQTLLQA